MPRNTQKRIIIIGLGNPLLTDDAIGLLTVQEFERRHSRTFPFVEFKLNYSGGFDLLYDILGFEVAIFVDSIVTNQVEPGFCLEISLEDLVMIHQSRLTNSHGLNLPIVLAAGKKCGYALPDQIVIYGIEGKNFYEFSELPTDQTKKGIENTIHKLIIKLDELYQNN